MNIGTTRHPRYICDKCDQEIYYIGGKGFVGINRYCKSTHRDINYKKDFDLCASCEKKFRKWLKEKEIAKIDKKLHEIEIEEEFEDYKKHRMEYLQIKAEHKKAMVFINLKGLTAEWNRFSYKEE